MGPKSLDSYRTGDCHPTALTRSAGRTETHGGTRPRTKEGQRRTIRWTLKRLTDKEGALSYIVGSGIDVTEQRAAQNALQQARDEKIVRIESSARARPLAA